MADETVIGFRVDVQTEAGQETVGELRREFIEAKKAVLEAKAGTEEYNKALLVLAEKKAKIQDLNQTIRALNPEQLINNFSRLGTAIVGGFTAATSAAALFGIESEDVHKSLLKVQAAMGLLQGFQAIQEGIKAFGFLRIAITQVVTQLGVMKTAMIATGIGAFAIAVGFLVSLMDDNAETTDKAAKAQERYNAALRDEIDFQNFLASVRATNAEHALAMAKIQGESLETIKNLEQQVVDAKLKGFQDIRDKGIDLSDEQLVQELSLKNKKMEIEAQYTADVKKEMEKRLKDQKEMNEQRKKLELEYYLDRIETGLLMAAIGQKSELEKQKEYLDTLDRLQEESNQVQIAGLTNAVKQKLEITLEDLNRQKAIAAAKIMIEQSVFATITNLAFIFGKNTEKITEFQKKAALVQIIIDQAQALSSAVKMAIAASTPAAIAAGVGGPLVMAGYIAAAITSVTTIFASIKGLLSKAGGTGGLSLEGISGGGSGPVSVTPPVIQSESTIIGGQNTTNEDRPGTHPPIRAYVVESEISASQRRVDKLEAEASFG